MDQEQSKQLAQDQRAAYLAGTLTQQDYYCWLADFVGISNGMIPASNQRIKACVDPDLNGIPLFRWQALDSYARRMAEAKGLAWTPSDTVACLKAIAKRRAGINPGRTDGQTPDQQP